MQMRLAESSRGVFLTFSAGAGRCAARERASDNTVLK